MEVKPLSKIVRQGNVGHLTNMDQRQARAVELGKVSPPLGDTARDRTQVECRHDRLNQYAPGAGVGYFTERSTARHNGVTYGFRDLERSVMQIRKAWDLVDEAKARIENVGVEQARAELEAGKAVLVDIRDIRERLTKGAIPGSVHAPRGMLEFWVDPASEYYRDVFHPDRRYILYCAGGGRSALAADTMRAMGYPDVAHLEPGFDGWADAGGEVEDVAASAKWQRRTD